MEQRTALAELLQLLQRLLDGNWKVLQSDPIGLWGGRNTVRMPCRSPRKIKHAVYDGRLGDLLAALDLNPFRQRNGFIVTTSRREGHLKGPA
jgi:hypothetical protein